MSEIMRVNDEREREKQQRQKKKQTCDGSYSDRVRAK